MKATLYLVDDEPMAIKYFEYLLSCIHVDCELIGSATNSKKALREIKQLQPDIVFTDISMPLMDGFVFAEEVRKAVPAKIYFLTAYKDFDYIKRGMEIGVTDYILKNELNEDALQKILDKAVAEVTEENKNRHMMLEVNMRNFLMSNSEMQEAHIAVNKGMRRYGLVTLNAVSKVYIKYRPEEAALKLDSYELQKLAWPEGVTCRAFVRMLRGEYCGVFQLEATVTDSQKALRDSVELIQNYLAQAEQEASCCISDTISDFFALPAVYLESRQLVTYCFAYPRQRIFSMNQLRENEARRSSSVAPWDELMKNAKVDMLPENRESHLSNIAVLLKKCRERQNLREYEETLRSVFHILRSYIQQYQLDPSYLTEQECYENTEEAEQAILENLNKIYDAKEQADHNHYSVYVQNALFYIQKNYQRDISIPEIAEEVKVSEGHLRRCFKQELDVRIVDYLVDYRLKQAKRMIREGEDSLTVVWQSTGFSSAQYFSYVFKKKEGILPKDYMKQVRGN